MAETIKQKVTDILGISSQPTRKLGKNGPNVTAIGFGCMGLSAFYGKPKPDSERFAMLDHVYQSGCLNWDSADVYLDNEDLIGQWFKLNHGAREKIFLATKFAIQHDPATGQRSFNNSPEYVRSACMKSLERLGIDQIDLYYCHRLDANQPVEITVKAMKQLQDEGKVRYLGLSEVSSDTLRRACKVVHIDAVQMEYSPFSMDVEHEGLLQTCRELGVAMVAYSPLGRGFLTGSVRSRKDLEEGDFRLNAPRFSEENFHKNLELVDTLKKIAEKKECSVGQLTLAFLLNNGDDIIPIPGTTRIKNFDENMKAAKIKLSPEEVKEVRSAIGSADIAGGRYPDGPMQKAVFVNTLPLDPKNA